MASLSVPLIRSPLEIAANENRLHPHDDPNVETHDETLFENPQFQHYEETSNIQLFFDLFFVANLTSFTNAHEVNSTAKLSTYIGFFCILWFTWCQVTMYDVRFATDSIFERLAHACHFGVMVGLAVVGPQFDDPSSIASSTLKRLSLILMLSRVVLFFQYSSTLYFSWRYRITHRPLIATLISLAIAAMMYLGLSFATSGHSYLAWYVISVFEVAANIAIGGKWHVVSFKGTHLTERMTCLTLIILGEGVIGLTKSLTKIEGLDFNFSPSTIGTIISALLIIYLVYQLYFDNVKLEHFGILRQQFWTFLHFPFHMALVLLMEGTNQLVSWRHVIEYVNKVFDPLFNVILDDNATLPELITSLNDTIITVFSNSFLQLNEDVFEQVQDSFNLLSNGTSGLTPEELSNNLGTILIDLLKLVVGSYGFEPPDAEDEGDKTFIEIFNDYYGVFDLVFQYFFICAGLVLIFLAILSYLAHSKNVHELRSHYVSIISKLILGIGLMLCTIMVRTSASSNLGESPWPLPLLFFVLSLALIFNHIPWGVGAKRVKDEEDSLDTSRES